MQVVKTLIYDGEVDAFEGEDDESHYRLVRCHFGPAYCHDLASLGGNGPH